MKNDYLDLFDGPDGNIQMSERKVTTTTLQALFMMNSDFTHERSSAISERVLKTSKTTEARIRNAYQLLFGRPPNQSETAHVARIATQLEAKAGVETAWLTIIRSMISSNEFLYID